MKRRSVLFGALSTSMAPAFAQGAGPLRRLGILWGGSHDTNYSDYLDAFQMTLKDYGWVAEQTIRIDTRWGNNDPTLIASAANELLAQNPDVILAGPTSAVLPLKAIAKQTPIVFISVSDPVGRGVVDSLSRPTANLTGFSNKDPSLIGKWLQLIREISPGLTKVTMLSSTFNLSAAAFFRVFHQMALDQALEPIEYPVQTRDEMMAALNDFAGKQHAALIVPGDTFTARPENRSEFLKAVFNLPSPIIYGDHSWIRSGGLISYDHEEIEQFQKAAGYVSRILRGAPVSSLPVQDPTRFTLKINLATARRTGIVISPTLIALADEVIE